jgi:probable rRNA maturation factor
MQDPQVDLDIKYHVAVPVTDERRMQSAAAWIVKEFGLKRLASSVAIVDDETIHRVNREHLQHDWPTDVISFVFDNENDVITGEVIASADTALRLHQAAGWQLEDEILLYVVHGLLHLAGLDDIEEQQSEQMRRAERDCLLAVGVPGAEEHLKRWHDISY